MTQGTTLPPQSGLKAAPASPSPRQRQSDDLTETLILAPADDPLVRPFEYHATDED